MNLNDFIFSKSKLLLRSKSFLSSIIDLLLYLNLLNEEIRRFADGKNLKTAPANTPKIVKKLSISILEKNRTKNTINIKIKIANVSK